MAWVIIGEQVSGREFAFLYHEEKPARAALEAFQADKTVRRVRLIEVMEAIT